ncbi:MAG: hypothetical protein WCF67_14280 [Chitinophagaceae bacterium]
MAVKAGIAGMKQSLRTEAGETAGNKQQPATNSKLDEDDSYEEYSQKIDGLDDIVVKLGLHRRINSSHKYMYEMGRRDGALGVTLDVVNIARATAQAMFRHIYVILRGKIGALDADLKSKENIMKDDERLYQREQAYYDYAKYQYRFFPRSHSFLLFALYFVVALALIIADMPLALKLVQTGFDLEGSGFSELFVKGKFWDVIASNWETTFTSVGIALCTIYIKIYYDEFVGTPYANRLMTFRKFLDENGMGQLDKDRVNIKAEHYIKASLKTVLFLSTLTAIVSLAFFRLETAAANNEFVITGYSRMAFIAITVLFPLIGGICLSYSLNNLQNLMRIREAKRKCNSSRAKLLRAVKEYTASKGNSEDLAAAAERLGDEGKVVEEYKDYLVAFYERGYAIGGMQPEKYTRGEDFYTKILEWRNIAISRKINHHIGKLN